MNELPEELIVNIFIFMSFQDVMKNTTLVSKNFNQIIVNHFLKRKITKYVISKHEDYKLLLKFESKIKTLIIIGTSFINEFELVNINYEKLFLKKVCTFNFPNVNCLDHNISKKCKKITFYKSFLSESFMKSLKYLVLCRSLRLYKTYGCTRDQDYIYKCMKTLPNLQKISLSHLFLNNRQLCLMTGYQIIIFERVYMVGDLELLFKDSKVHLIKCYLRSFDNFRTPLNQIIIGQNYKF